MKLVFLYGPPGSGKYTIGKALAEQTSLPFFYNHLVVDITRLFFPMSSEPYVRLNREIRATVLRFLVQKNVPGVIFTFAWSKKDAPFVKRIIKIVEGGGGKVCFVELRCEQKELERRMNTASRRKQRKITDIAVLRAAQEKFQYNQGTHLRKTLVLDTTNVTPENSARRIRKHYSL